MAYVCVCLCCVRGDAADTSDYKGRDDYGVGAASGDADDDAFTKDYGGPYMSGSKYSPHYGAAGGQYMVGATQDSKSDTFV